MKERGYENADTNSKAIIANANWITFAMNIDYKIKFVKASYHYMMSPIGKRYLALTFEMALRSLSIKRIMPITRIVTPAMVGTSKNP